MPNNHMLKIIPPTPTPHTLNTGRMDAWERFCLWVTKTKTKKTKTKTKKTKAEARTRKTKTKAKTAHHIRLYKDKQYIEPRCGWP